MDTRKFSASIIKPEDLYDGPMREKIVNVFEHEKYLCLVLQFESGSQFYSWPNYTRILNEAWGCESENWLQQELELPFDHYPDRKTGEQKETVKLIPISPAKPGAFSAPSKAIAPSGAAPRGNDTDDDIPFAPEWR